MADVYIVTVDNNVISIEKKEEKYKPSAFFWAGWFVYFMGLAIINGMIV